VLVDGTSAAGAITVDPREFDAYYFSPQKAFGSEGGLWLAILSPAAVDRAESMAASSRWTPPFLDIANAIANSRQDQTYNTPALTTLALLRDQIDWIQDMGGLEAAAARSLATSGLIYDWAASRDFASPFVAIAAQRSPTVVTIDLVPEVPATDVSAVLRANGIVDTESYRRLGRNQLRVASFPAIETGDAELLTRAIDHVVAALAP
jgi:phosphoserine aminotransferase